MDWEFQKRDSKCNICNNPFIDRQSYFTFLLYGDPVRRIDTCLECAPYAEGHIFCSWKGLFRIPVPPPEPVPMDLSERLLRRFLTENSDDKKNVCYILAAMLERKKILIQKGKKTDKQKNAVFFDI